MDMHNSVVTVGGGWYKRTKWFGGKNTIKKKKSLHKRQWVFQVDIQVEVGTASQSQALAKVYSKDT